MKTAYRYFLCLALLVLLQVQSLAQCAMCNATAESSIDSGSTAATGLNMGVLYLLLMPILFASAFFLIYWKRKKDLRRYSDFES